jgi:hypothetical protein
VMDGDGLLYYERSPWPVRDVSISMIFYSIQKLHLTMTDSLTSDFDYKVQGAEQLSLRGVRFMVRYGT